jgi:hypothetical protein
MIGSLLALLIASAQPAPAEEPVVEVQAEVQTEVQPDVQPETPAAQAQVEAEAEATAPAEPEEEVICRRRLVPSARIGQRNRVVRDCRPASEWESARRRR